MFGVMLKATNSSFQKGMTCCRSISVKKVIKLLAFIFEHFRMCIQKHIQLIIAQHKTYVGMIKKSHSQTLQTKQLYGENEPHNTKESQNLRMTIKINQTALSSSAK